MFCSMTKNGPLILNLMYFPLSQLGMKNESNKLQLRLIQPAIGFCSYDQMW